MGDKSLENKLKTRYEAREQKIPDYQNMTIQEKNKLQQELQHDHQKVLFREASSQGEEKEYWRQVRLALEEQSQKLKAEEKIAYQRFTKPMIPKQTVVKNTIIAFLVGGLICTIGQIIMNYAMSLGLSQKEAGAVTAGTLVFAGALLTGLGIYDEIGRFAGAGSIVPITGFANSIVSSALEFKREGYVYGVGAHIFTIAGPVLAYGTLVSFLVGIIYYLTW